jgi:hypothetical protein
VGRIRDRRQQLAKPPDAAAIQGVVAGAARPEGALELIRINSAKIALDVK